MIRIKVLIFLFLVISLSISAQELDAKLSISTQKVESVDKQAITEMEAAVKQMLNEQSWTNVTFDRNERIDCSIGITLNNMPNDNTYVTEVHVTSRRPIYNSVYLSPQINYRDGKVDFNYQMGQSLDYNEISFNNNLVAVVAFYVNIVLGLDFDSFSPNGGKAYFTKAMDIANTAQSLGTRGWEPFSGNSRYDLALALTEESSKSFHSLWYNYHRLGLDEMSGNPSRARLRMIDTLKDLEELYKNRPSSILITIFAETKLDEFVKVCTKATAEEKKDIKERLKKIFPTKRTIIDSMK